MCRSKILQVLIGVGTNIMDFPTCIVILTLAAMNPMRKSHFVRKGNWIILHITRRLLPTKLFGDEAENLGWTTRGHNRGFPKSYAKRKILR